MKRGVMLVFASMLFAAFAPTAYAQDASGMHHASFVTLIGLLYFATLLTFLARCYWTYTEERFTSATVRQTWTLIQFLIRDGLLVLTFALSLLLLQPSLYASYHLAVPFVPLSVALLGLALYIRLVHAPDEIWPAFWTGLILLGGFIAYSFQMFMFWSLDSYHWLVADYSSLSQPGLAALSLKASAALLGLLLTFLFFHFATRLFSRWKPDKKKHPHGFSFTVLFTALAIILFLLLFMIMLSRLTEGWRLWR